MLNKCKPLPQSFYNRPTTEVAQELLGKILVHQLGSITLSGIITETEAYGGTDDPASHAFRGITPRNFPMFGPVGHSYVYFIYGNHFCFNIVAHTQPANAGAVLIRSIEPMYGIDEMLKRRNLPTTKNLSNGPGKLTQALGITREHTNLDLTNLQTNLYVFDGAWRDSVSATPRIGIKVGTEQLWRFVTKAR
jgi:DNA-3-methyladenine glycosylase